MPWQRWQGAAVLPLSWRRGNFEPRVSGPATWPSICSFDFGGMTASQSVRCLALAAPMVPLLLIACGCVEVFSLGVGITVGLKMLTLLFIGGAEVHSFRAASEQMQAWSLPSARFFHPNGAKKPCGFGDVDRIGCATARTIFQGFHVIEAPASVVACVRYGICLARSGPFLGDQELHPGKSSFFQDGFVASSPPSPIPGSTSPATRSGSAGALAGEQRAEDDGVATGLLVRRGHLSTLRVHQHLPPRSPCRRSQAAPWKHRLARRGVIDEHDSARINVYPKNETELLAHDRWIAGTLDGWKESTVSRAQEAEQSEMLESPDPSIPVKFSRSAIDWALQTFTPDLTHNQPPDVFGDPLARRTVELLQQAMPGLDLDAPLSGLDSLRVSYLTSTLRSHGVDLRANVVRQASSLRALATLSVTVPSAVCDVATAASPEMEYAIWYTPGQHQAMGPWLCRGPRDVNVESMKRADCDPSGPVALLGRFRSLRAFLVTSASLQFKNFGLSLVFGADLRDAEVTDCVMLGAQQLFYKYAIAVRFRVAQRFWLGWLSAHMQQSWRWWLWTTCGSAWRSPRGWPWSSTLRNPLLRCR
eukprot:s303_g34.t3